MSTKTPQQEARERAVKAVMAINQFQCFCELCKAEAEQMVERQTQHILRETGLEELIEARDQLRQQLKEMTKDRDATVEAYGTVCTELADARNELETFKASEKCTKCQRLWSPSLIESGVCIFCILNEARAYADKLAAGLPEGMLPKDIENLRDANVKLADELQAANDMLNRVHDECDKAGIPRDDSCVEKDPELVIALCEGARVKMLREKLRTQCPAGVCNHIVSYADLNDAKPCPVCERDQLRAEVAALRADKERLDWLEEYYLKPEWLMTLTENIRSKIDAARKDRQ